MGRRQGGREGPEGGEHLASFSLPLTLMVVQPVAMPLAMELDVLALRHGDPASKLLPAGSL